MVSYAKYSPVPTEEPKKDMSGNSAFDYSSAFNYKSAFDYQAHSSSHFQSAFDYGYKSDANKSSIMSKRDQKRRRQGFGILDCISTFITYFSYVLIAATFPFTLWFCIKKLEQWERLIVFRIGRLHGVLGPGMVFIIPWIDRFNRVDLRTKAFSVPPQQLITVDNGIIEMGCEIKYRVSDVQQLTTSVTTPLHGLRSFGKTVMLNVLTKHTVKEMERDRPLIVCEILRELNARVSNWGIEIGEVDLSTVNVLKEPEPKNPLKPLLGAMGGGGSKDDSSSTILQQFGSLGGGASNLAPPIAPVDKGSSSLLDFSNLAKLSGLGGFQGFSATAPDSTKLKEDSLGVSGGSSSINSKLGRFLQGLVEGPSGTDLGQGIYRLQIEGKDSAVFIIFVGNGMRQVVEGDLPKVTPDVSVTMTKEDLMSILEGTVPPLQAYLSGRLTVSGNIQLLMGLESLRQTSGSPNGTSAEGAEDMFVV